MSKSGISGSSAKVQCVAEQTSVLMPYGSMRHLDLVAKVGDVSKIRTEALSPYGAIENLDLVAKVGGSTKVQRAALSPYGAIEHVDLAAKVGFGAGKVDRRALSGRVESRRVVRLNRAG